MTELSLFAWGALAGYGLAVAQDLWLDWLHRRAERRARAESLAERDLVESKRALGRVARAASRSERGEGG